jgi:hypothetical protein
MLLQDDPSNYDLNANADAVSFDELSAAHIDTAAPSMKMTMVEIAITQELRFKALAAFIHEGEALASINTGLSVFVPHTRWEQLRIDSKGRVVPP